MEIEQISYLQNNTQVL